MYLIGTYLYNIIILRRLWSILWYGAEAAAVCAHHENQRCVRLNDVVIYPRWLFAESHPTNGTIHSRGKTVTTSLRLGLMWLIWYGSVAAPCCNRVPMYHLSKATTREPNTVFIYICIYNIYVPIQCKAGH